MGADNYLRLNDNETVNTPYFSDCFRPMLKLSTTRVKAFASEGYQLSRNTGMNQSPNCQATRTNYRHPEEKIGWPSPKKNDSRFLFMHQPVRLINFPGTMRRENQLMKNRISG